MEDLFGNKLPDQMDPEKAPATKVNPMCYAFGELPGFKCKDCTHLFFKQFARRYYKCELRKNTDGAATDHQVNWPACKKFMRKAL